ncbi:MAG: ubiquinone/menaquinone biosynthesis methyltransferase [Campylobacterales bacterium]
MENKVVRFFDSIAPKYDLINKIASFGIDRRWREVGGEMLLSRLPKRAKIGDLAIGTGEMAEVLLRKGEREGISLQLIGIDPSRGMLEVARRRLDRWGEQVQLKVGWGEKLPMEGEGLEGVSIGFGLRNYRDPIQGVREIYRVLKPGGHFLVLEFFRGRGGVRKVVDLYTSHFLPFLGGKLAGNREAYSYLATSIANFYTIEEFLEIVEWVGFSPVEERRFNFGQVGILLFKK